ncbi:GIY-YIG nuclease family protein [Sporomusa sp.]|uniref:GIY-YIG nuclease family protein n=1 Tax=Sporomusa sp. TaxID=2078658 RepID=UPI002CA3240D|nr:GIY-YIG nuclease family protein [Sporomusa sp.]HWR43607.1 GIY-YIG nuclease family protein [Sporomusa sp.]
MDKRKELKLAYKETPRPMGAYQIKNNVTGKIYVGSGMNLPGNFNSHRFQLNFKSHRNKALQEDWNLYGSDAFTFEVLESINADKISKDSWRKAVSELEDKWLNILQPYGDKGYNPPPTPAKQALVAADTSL